MNERKLSNFCMLMLAFSVLVRLLAATGGSACAQEPAAQPRLWRVEVVRGQREGGAEAAALQEGPPADKPAPPQLEFSPEEADAITIAGGCTYDVDKAALLTRPSALDVSGDGPKVLIVHTHSSEAYTQEAGWEYTPSDPLRTEEPARSVIRVGDEIAAVLESRGIEVLHDTALNDYPTYNGAYARMEATIERYLKAYPSIQMVLDVHRDSLETDDGTQLALRADVDGEACAKLLLVMGSNGSGLEHPGWRQNLANAARLQALCEQRTPGLMRDLLLRASRYNQHLTPRSMLLEVGTAGNSLEEALRSADIFSQALADCLLGKA